MQERVRARPTNRFPPWCAAAVRLSAPQSSAGLWAAFHAMSVRQPLSKRNGGEEGPAATAAMVRVLRGFVGSFFGCRECRDHFLAMTVRDVVSNVVRGCVG